MAVCRRYASPALKLPVTRPRPWARAALLKPRLDALLKTFDFAGRLPNDPVEQAHRYSAQDDIEVAALLASAVAYGSVKLFKPRLTALLDALGPSPAAAARTLDPKRWRRQVPPFAYRMTGQADIACLLLGAGRALNEHGTLGALYERRFSESAGDAREALTRFVADLTSPDFTPIAGQRGPTRRLKHLLSSPERGSACKRLNLFLRWMVRGPDGVDFGLWRVPTRSLVIPLDTHVHRIGGFLGLTRRKDLSWRTAAEITARLAELDPDDPVKYDFALSHLGISGACPSRRDPVKCEGCGIRQVCRMWT